MKGLFEHLVELGCPQRLATLTVEILERDSYGERTPEEAEIVRAAYEAIKDEMTKRAGF